MLSEIGRETDRTLGTSSDPPPEISLSEVRTLKACLERGTRCGRRIFMRASGMIHTELSKSNSFHSAARSSPGRGNSSAISFRAARVVGCPSNASIALSKPPKALGSVIAARGVTVGLMSAPLRAIVGSASARAVAIANRNTVPIVERRRLADSYRPRTSTRRRAVRMLAVSISRMHLAPIVG